MSTFYATKNWNGLVSKRIEASDKYEAQRIADQMTIEADDLPTDAEEDFGFDGSHQDADECDSLMEEAGLSRVIVGETTQNWDIWA